MNIGHVHGLRIDASRAYCGEGIDAVCAVEGISEGIGTVVVGHNNLGTELDQLTCSRAMQVPAACPDSELSWRA